MNWKQRANHAEHLDITIWAIYRSGTLENKNLQLDELIEYWAEMPDLEVENRDSYQLDMAKESVGLIKCQLIKTSIQYLNRFNSDLSLRRQLRLLSVDVLISLRR